MLVSYLGEYDAKTSVSGNGFVQWHRHVTENRPFRQFAEKATTSVHPKRFVTSASGNGFVRWHSHVLKIDPFVNLQKKPQQVCIQSVLWTRQRPGAACPIISQKQGFGLHSGKKQRHKRCDASMPVQREVARLRYHNNQGSW
jgi:hypothetical protein